MILDVIIVVIFWKIIPLDKGIILKQIMLKRKTEILKKKVYT